MPWSLPPQTSFLVLSILLALLAFMSFISSLVAARRRRLFGTISGGVMAVVTLLASLLFGAVSVGLRGYEALTREDVIVVVHTTPIADQRFEARFVFPNGTERTFELAGDQLYVDAHILKWKPIANVFGLHTQYALDRVSGRYEQLKHERTRPRTVFAVGEQSAIDLYRLRQRWDRLSPLYDTEYGSATWVDARSAGSFELRVSTTGLLVRPLGPEDPGGMRTSG
jgi:hypothetical protein